MSEEQNQEILNELKKINEKLDSIQQRGLSAPIKFIAILLGLTIVGPLFMLVIGIISRFFK
jgi:hypothetical protein